MTWFSHSARRFTTKKVLMKLNLQCINWSITNYNLWSELNRLFVLKNSKIKNILKIKVFIRCFRHFVEMYNVHDHKERLGATTMYAEQAQCVVLLKRVTKMKSKIDGTVGSLLSPVHCSPVIFDLQFRGEEAQQSFRVHTEINRKKKINYNQFQRDLTILPEDHVHVVCLIHVIKINRRNFVFCFSFTFRLFFFWTIFKFLLNIKIF